jgi:integrase
MMKMTKRDIAGLKSPDPRGKQLIYWAEGSEHPGLGILVSGTTTAKSWVVQGKLKGGTTRRVTLGPVAVLSLDEAWEKARPVLADLHSDVDPKAKKHKPATVREALEQYLRNPKLAERTKHEYRGRAERHLADWLDMPIAAITPNMAEARFLAITGEVEARRAAGGSRGGFNVTGAATANGALSILRTLWRDQKKRVAEMQTLLDPTALLSGKWHELQRRQRFVEPAQMPSFYAGILGLSSRLYRDLLTMALFTGWRAMEISGLRWSEVELGERMTRIPAARMKGRKDFELPMSDQLAEVLVARRALGNDGPFVFPGEGKTGHTQSMPVALDKVAAATGITVSPHDLRRTFISIAENCPISPFSLKRLVAHTTTGDVTSGYIQKTREQLREAAQVVADRISELCEIPQAEGIARLK